MEATKELPYPAAGGRPSYGIVALFIASALLWFVLCRALSSEWAINEQYNYGWFVPFFAAYLLWLRWEDPPLRSQTSDLRGQRFAIATSVAALLLLAPVRLFEVANPDWRPLGWLHAAAVVALTLTAVWWSGGSRWLRHFAFPVCFIFVAVPWISAIEEPVVQTLMRTVAAMAAETVSLFGIPAAVEGNLIRVAHGVVGVNEACSGVRSLQTSLMIGLLFGEVKRLTLGRRLALIVTALGIAFLANFARAVFLVMVAALESLDAMEKWHDLAGYAIIAVVFAGTMWIAAQMRRTTNAQRRIDRAPGISWRSVHLPVSALICSLLCIVATELCVEWWYRMHERQMPPAQQWTIRWPEQAPGFRNEPLDESVRQTLRFDEGREATWAIPSEAGPPRRCLAFFFRWNPGGSSVVRARAHRPDICLPSQGWNPLGRGEVRDFRINSSLVLPFRHIDFGVGSNGGIAHTFFCLQEDRHTQEARTDLSLPQGIQPDWSFPARFAAVRNGVRNMGQQVLEIVLLSPARDPQAADAAFSRLLPLMIEPVGTPRSVIKD